MHFFSLFRKIKLKYGNIIYSRADSDLFGEISNKF